MNIGKAFLGATLASVLAVAAPAAAGAATTIIPFGNTPATSGGFLDIFTFTTPTAGRVSITLNSAISGPLTDVNFRNRHVTINGTPLVTLSKGVTELWQIVHQPVGMGLQTLSIEGSAQRLGTYSGNIVFDVPEPATWALMILGMGAVGFAMRRRPTARVAFDL